MNAPLMDGFSHIVAYALTALMYLLTISLAGGTARLWSAMDISDSIGRYKQGLLEIDDGAASLMHFLGYGAISLFLLYFVWHFDIQSSWNYSADLQLAMAASVASIPIGRMLLSGITFLPTLIELFGAKFAKKQDLWSQILVIGLAGFDLLTDREPVRAFIEPKYPVFVNAQNSYLMNILFEACYYYIFGLWWVLASYGFEAAFVCYTYASLGCFVKWITGRRRSAAYGS